MRSKVIIGAVAVFLLAGLLVASFGLGYGNGTKGTEVWWYEGGPLIKATLRVTSDGIVEQCRFEPQRSKLLFKPVDRFSRPDQGDCSLWTFSPTHYRLDEKSPGTLSDFFVEGGEYWLQTVTPN